MSALRSLQYFFLLSFLGMPCFSETGYITAVVHDAKQLPVRRAEIGVEVNDKGKSTGSVVSKLTKDDGTAELPLSHNIHSADWITVRLIHSPPGRDLAIVSPWDNHIPVPSFVTSRENRINIVVVQRGDRAALENHTITTSLAARINQINAVKSGGTRGPQVDPEKALLAIANQYGLNPEDVDTAIRTLGTKTNEEKKAGIIFLYERNYPKAAAAFTDSLQQTEQKLQAVKKMEIQYKQEAGEESFF